MAKGGGGEGQYDERRRAAKPRVVSGYADSPEVLAAVVKPRAKPDVVIKKKPILTPTKKPAKTVPGLRMGAAQAEVRVGNLSRKRDLGPFDDQIVVSSRKADRDYGDIVNRTAKSNSRYDDPNFNVANRALKTDLDQFVNRTAKADRDYGDIVNTAAKGDRWFGDIVNTAAKEDRDTGGVSPASVITAPRKYPTPDRSAKGNRGGGYTPQRDKDNAFPNISNYDPGGGLYGQGKSLLDWVKRRNSKRMLDM